MHQNQTRNKRPYIPEGCDQQGRIPRLPFEWEGREPWEKVAEVVTCVLLFASVVCLVVSAAVGGV